MQTVFTLFKNSTFSIITNTLNRIGNAVIFILIVQFLGIEKGGIYTIGVSYFFIGSRFAFWGLDHLLTREVAKDRKSAQKYISNFLIVRLLLSSIVILIALAIVQSVNYEGNTKLVISLMLLSIWPENTNNLCWAAFAAFEEFHFTSISVFFGSLFQIILGGLFLWLGFDVIAMAVVFFVNNMVAMIINLYILKIRYVQEWEWPDKAFIQKQLRIGLPFVFIGVFFILDNRLDTIVLSFLASEEVVGLYSAATAVTVALAMIPQGYRVAILPVLARYRLENPTKVEAIYAQSYKLLFIIGLPISAATFLLAGDLIKLLYGESLPSAIPALQIISIVLVLTFLNVLDSRLLIVYDKQSITAKFLILTTILNAAINIALAPKWGAIGASMARLTSITVLFICNTLAVRSIVKNNTQVLTFLKTIFCTIGMSLVVWLMQPLGFWWQVLGGSLIYPLLLIITGTLSPDEQKIALNILKMNFAKKQ